MLSKSTIAYFHWSCTRARPFSRVQIQLDLSKLRASPETLASIYGVPLPQSLYLKQESNILSFDRDQQCWPDVQAGEHYQVHVEKDDENEMHDATIKDLYQLVGGEERILGLSSNFYHRVWYDETTPPAFRRIFRHDDKDNNNADSPEKHARNQAAWFCEMWGGPPRYTNQFGPKSLLRGRMLPLHSPRRMTFEHTMSWLQIMKAAVNEEFDNEQDIQKTLSLYWLHFLAFFPYEEDERATFRKILFETLGVYNYYHVDGLQD